MALLDDGNLTGWLSIDNHMVAMDDTALRRLKIEMGAFRSRLRLAGRGLKDRLNAGEKIATLNDDALWS